MHEPEREKELSRCEREKPQAPGSKLQRSSNSQALIAPGAWEFSGAWGLELGASSFIYPHMSELSIGTKAPAFTALAVGGKYDGKTVKLGDLKGHAVVLYFYPKDDTPGCTTQACGLRDAWRQLAKKAEIFGVSIDSAKSHRKFIDKFALPFPLLVDEEKKIVEAYGVWVEKSMYGKKYMGTERSTFVIGADGKLKAVLRKVKPAEHVEQLLAAL
jgi:peroxiredoxin Q/BCP